MLWIKCIIWNKKRLICKYILREKKKRVRGMGKKKNITKNRLINNFFFSRSCSIFPGEGGVHTWHMGVSLIFIRLSVSTEWAGTEMHTSLIFLEEQWGNHTIISLSSLAPRHEPSLSVDPTIHQGKTEIKSLIQPYHFLY